MTEAYRAYIAQRGSPPERADTFIAHYGVKGQKWGVRNYQYEGGGYTPAGAERYWGGTGQGRRSSSGSSYTPTPRRRMPAQARNVRRVQRSASVNASSQRQITPEQRAARRARTRKILAVTAGVAVAAALGYAAYRGSTKLRNQARRDVYKNIDPDWRNLNTMNSKYWDSSDRHRYTEATKQHADYVARSITRRDAVANKFAEKTGIRINLPQNRQKVLADRHEANNYANLIRDIERRGHLNQQISNARKDLHRSELLSQRMSDIRFKSQERYGEQLDLMNQQNVERYRKRLNSLLDQRRAL